MAFRDKLKEQLTLIEAAQNSKKPGPIYIDLRGGGTVLLVNFVSTQTNIVNKPMNVSGLGGGGIRFD